MLRNTKVLVALIISILMMMGVCGCMNNYDLNPATEKVPVKEEMLTYMNQKYDTEFTFVKGDTQLWSAKYAEMIVSSPEYPDASIFVRKDGDGTLSDNYMAFVFKEAFEKRFEEIAGEIYGKCVACSMPTREMLPNSVTPDTSLADYLSARTSFLSITLFVAADTNSKDTDVEALTESLRKNECRTNYDIYYVSQDVLDTITTENYRDILESSPAQYSLIGGFVLDKNYDLIYAEWRS